VGQQDASEINQTRLNMRHRISALYEVVAAIHTLADPLAQYDRVDVKVTRNGATRVLEDVTNTASSGASPRIRRSCRDYRESRGSS
jgi:hypothetical protein